MHEFLEVKLVKKADRLHLQGAEDMEQEHEDEADDEDEASFEDSSSSSEEEEEDEADAEEARQRAMAEAKAILQDKKGKSKDRYLEDEVHLLCLSSGSPHFCQGLPDKE